jgi:flagella basal body P-ring formation protein FlgA
MRRRAMLALLAWPMAAEAAEVAMLHPQVLLDADVLRLSDLWENAGPRGATVLAAAPLPGRRMVLETVNLVNLARQYGVNWRPMTGSERAVVERPGRQVPRAEIEAMLRDELARRASTPSWSWSCPASSRRWCPPARCSSLAWRG